MKYEYVKLRNLKRRKVYVYICGCMKMITFSDRDKNSITCVNEQRTDGKESLGNVLVKFTLESYPEKINYERND